MNTFNFIIDLHCHPAMKPYGRSFDKQIGHNSSSPHDINSIWYYDSPTLVDKLFNYAFGLTKFRQADFTSAQYGNVQVMVASLYPIEKGFVTNKLGSGQLSDAALCLATGIGDSRIDHLQKMPDYCADLNKEYSFYEQLHDHIVTIDNKQMRYKLVRNFAQLQQVIEQPDPSLPTLAVIMSIEGAHVFNCGLNPQLQQADPAAVIANIRQVKQWAFPPFFITLAHHFYNELCGHAQSLTGFMAKILDQKYKMDTGITELGKQVIRELLSNTSGPRILVDIKHMSPLARREYFQLLDTEYAGQSIPLVVSHGAANGLKAFDNNFIALRPTGELMRAASINFYDDEIIRIAQSEGIFGLQMDERRVGSDKALRQASGRLERRKILYYRSKLVWNQIQHIAEVLSGAGIYPWGITSLGTDFDGIIDPLNGYWTYEDLQSLDDYLLKHAFNYMQAEGRNLRLGANTDPEEIVTRVMHTNALDFLRKNF